MLRRTFFLHLRWSVGSPTPLLLRPKQSSTSFLSKKKKRMVSSSLKRRKQAQDVAAAGHEHVSTDDMLLEPHDATMTINNAAAEHNQTVEHNAGFSLKARPSVSWQANDGAASVDAADEIVNHASEQVPSDGGAEVVGQHTSAPPARNCNQSILAERQHVLSAINDGGLESALKHESAIRIERRRSRPTISDTEFDVGMSERLFPEMPRLTALSEVHHSDCTVACWDEEAFLAHQRQIEASSVSKQHLVTASISTTTTATLAPNDKTTNIDDDNLLAAEDPPEVPQPLTTSAGSELLDAPPATSSAVLSRSTCEAHTIQPLQVIRSTPSLQKYYRPIPSDSQISPSSTMITLQPLSIRDVVMLYKFLKKLRGATPEELRNIDEKGNALSSQITSTTHNHNDIPCNMSELMKYLHGDADAGVPPAPSPILPFSSDTVVAPAFIFALYTENCSTQNALAHVAALFSVPAQRFMTCHVAAKMSATTVLCAVQSNVVSREQLLLLNTMRHPGFVLRVSNIQVVKSRVSDTELFSEIARAAVLTDVTMLVRRVSCGSVAEISKRLNALVNVGAIFYCGNRETALMRAATDVLHGYYRSAFLNGLFRRKAPIELREFIKNPTVASANRARKVATDSTIRQYLKGYIRSNGNFTTSVQQVPYVLRRKWINALRCQVWNVMASERVRGGRRMGKGLGVMVGDLILKPQFRDDAAMRMMANVKADHLMVCLTEEDAQQATLEDVFIPFFRGVLPAEVVAPESTEHPIMTATAMERVLRKLHALHLLHGMSEEAKRILDIRTDVSPMLFRRLIIRPCNATYEVLEDNVALRSLQYDASRQIMSPRLALQGVPEQKGTGLVDREFLLQATTFAATKSSGDHFGTTTTTTAEVSSQNAEAFFAPPTRDDYVVLGKARRDLQGSFVPRAPLAGDVEAFDRSYSVLLHVVCPNGATALLSMLREYFNLGGVLEESTSVLQHKIHRTRRELDVETPFLTAPRFCPACFNTCHDDVAACPEYLRKTSIRREKTMQLNALTNGRSVAQTALAGNQKSNAALMSSSSTPSDFVMNVLSAVEIHVSVRRRSTDGKWGIDLNRQLQWMSVKDASMLSRIALSGPLRTTHQLEEVKAFLTRQQQGGGGGLDLNEDEGTLMEVLTALSSPSPPQSANPRAAVPVSLVAAKAALRIDEAHIGSIDGSSSSSSSSTPSLLAKLKLQVTAVNGVAMATSRDVAAQFIHHKNALSIQLVFRPVQHVEAIVERIRQQTTPASPAVLEVEGISANGAPPLLPAPIFVDRNTLQTISELPREITVVITKVPQQSNDERKPSSSWGLELSKTTLALTNIATTMTHAGHHQEQHINSSTTSIIIPPITSNESVRLLLTKYPHLYRICEVDHQPVQTIDDIVAAVTRSSSGASSSEVVEVAPEAMSSLVLLLRKSTEGFQPATATSPSMTQRPLPPPAPPSVPSATAVAAGGGLPKNEATIAVSSAAAVGQLLERVATTSSTASGSGDTPLHAAAQHFLERRLGHLWSHSAAPTIHSPISYPFTVAIHRPAGATRWGLRLGEQSLWVRRVPPPTANATAGGGGDGMDSSSSGVTSSVFASHIAFARSISDVLQEQPAFEQSRNPQELPQKQQPQQMQWSPWISFIAGVEQRRVTSLDELMEQLKNVSRTSNEGSKSSSSHADSVSLQCVRVALPRLTVRGVPIPAVGEGERWGLRLRDDDSGTLLKADVNFPFGQKLLEATQDSARELSAVAGKPLSAALLFPSLVTLTGASSKSSSSSSPTAVQLRSATTSSDVSLARSKALLMVDDDDDTAASSAVKGFSLAAAGIDNAAAAVGQTFDQWADAQCSEELLRWAIHSITVAVPSSTSSPQQQRGESSKDAGGAGDDSSVGGVEEEVLETFVIDGSTKEAARVLQLLRDRGGSTKYHDALVSFELQQLVATAQN
ncbi:Hypothetical protein, putative [Bodo saltans]|uniref:Uncharacterized protein n=1 Tax=Bodo saltans TaxID=75058 RepID=A0A0S4IY47_BODSA|nr:Hypothetical protein, putative [Bodo saltans]|eukprot:CUG13933.1 Hypothetical protein, putative [Bodo saltans]